MNSIRLLLICSLAFAFNGYAYSAEPPINDDAASANEQQLLDQISLQEVQQILAEQDPQSLEQLNDQQLQQDQFGDVELDDVLSDIALPTESVAPEELVNHSLQAKPAIKQAKPLSVPAQELPQVLPETIGVGVKGEQEAILNQLDNSNLMDYKVPPKLIDKLDIQPEDEGIDPP